MHTAHVMEINFFWYYTGVNPWSAYFQYLFMWLILFTRRLAVATYLDDTTPYGANKTNNLVIKETEHFPRFFFDGLTWNSEKGRKSANTILSEIKNELLGMILDSKLSFEDHINNFNKKSSQKLNALARVAPYICLKKGKQLWKHL